jgi:hypothetical protein
MTSFHLTPPARPPVSECMELAEQCTLLPRDHTQPLLIDLIALQTKLDLLYPSSSSSSASASVPPTSSATHDHMSSSIYHPDHHHQRLDRTNDGQARTKSEDPKTLVLTWALQWNQYSERIAAEARALDAWRIFVETLVWQYPSTWTISVIVHILDVVLSQIQITTTHVETIATTSVRLHAHPPNQDNGHPPLSLVAAPLLEIIASVTVALSFFLRQPQTTLTSEKRMALLGRTMKAVQMTVHAAGNRAASRRARGSLYTCWLHLVLEESLAMNAKDGGRPEGLPPLPFEASFISIVARDASDTSLPLIMGMLKQHDCVQSLALYVCVDSMPLYIRGYPCVNSSYIEIRDICIYRRTVPVGVIYGTLIIMCVCVVGVCWSRQCV